jgi:hypothetical protein
MCGQCEQELIIAAGVLPLVIENSNSYKGIRIMKQHINKNRLTRYVASWIMSIAIIQVLWGLFFSWDGAIVSTMILALGASCCVLYGWHRGRFNVGSESNWFGR